MSAERSRPDVLDFLLARHAANLSTMRPMMARLDAERGGGASGGCGASVKSRFKRRKGRRGNR